MSEQPKYYTPSIEEFHVGFEYQFKRIDDDNSEWTDAVIKDALQLGDIWHTVYDLRVKCLDREDMESLGWNPAYYNDYEFNSGEFTLEWWDEKFPVKITKGGHTIFEGTIRNKSELKRVMQMVGIKNEKA